LCGAGALARVKACIATNHVGDSRPRLSGRAQLGEGLAGPRPRSKRVSFARDQKPTCIRQLSPGRGSARLQEAAEKLANVGLAVEERPFRAA